MKRIYLISLLTMACCLASIAQQTTDSVKIYFREGRGNIDFSIPGNRDNLSKIITKISSQLSDSTHNDLSLRIEANASPSGAYDFNSHLTEDRAQSILDFIQTKTPVSSIPIQIKANGIDWDGLAYCIRKGEDFAAKEKALQILQDTPIWIFNKNGHIVDGRKKRLMDLQSGKVYNQLIQLYFAELQNAIIILSYTKEHQSAAHHSPAEKPDEAKPSGKISSSASTNVKPEPQQEQAAQPQHTGNPENENPEPLHRIAIKTNFIYDALLMPSLEVEYRINNRWSINLEGDMAWWKNNDKHKFYQLATISPEGRYWFRTKKPWHGHYVGLFGGFSWFDLENGGRGYKGEQAMTGISYGYMWPISRNLSLEAGIGIGFMHGWYQEYLPIDGHYVYQQSSKLNYFGPLKLKFTIVWRLWDSKKGGEK